jgi:hypothetical protein
MTDLEGKEAVFRVTLSGLGFDLESYLGTCTVIDRRPAIGLPSAVQPVR